MFFISSIIYSETSLSRRFKIGFITDPLRSIKQSLYHFMRCCFVLFLIGTSIMLFESKSYITTMYTFPFAEVIGKKPGSSVDIIPFISSNYIALI